jgi:hypothetical protein
MDSRTRSLAQLAMSDGRDLAVGAGAQPPDVGLDVIDARVAFLDEADQPPEVHARAQQQRARREAVAPAAPGLLVVGLEARRQRPVGDRSHVGLVDAHAEGVRRDDDLGAILHEGLLAGAPLLRTHAGVVGDGRQTLFAQPRGDGVGVLSRAAVDDRRPRALVAEHVQQRRPLARDRALALDADHVEGHVRPIEARADRHRLVQLQASGDLLCDARRRRGRRGHHRRAAADGAAQRRDRVVQAQVVGAEVVAPLGNAVRLVDDEQRDLALCERRAKGPGREALGRGEDELRVAGGDLRECLLVVPVLHPRREHRRAHAGLLQAPPLVGHQRDQRADDDDEPDAGERGELIAQRLAAAGRHHDEAVLAGERCSDSLALAGAKRVQAEAPQQLLRRGRHRRCALRGLVRACSGHRKDGTSPCGCDRVSAWRSTRRARRARARA